MRLCLGLLPGVLILIHRAARKLLLCPAARRPRPTPPHGRRTHACCTSAYSSQPRNAPLRRPLGRHAQHRHRAYAIPRALFVSPLTDSALTQSPIPLSSAPPEPRRLAAGQTWARMLLCELSGRRGHRCHQPAHAAAQVRDFFWGVFLDKVRKCLAGSPRRVLVSTLARVFFPSPCPPPPPPARTDPLLRARAHHCHVHTRHSWVFALIEPMCCPTEHARTLSPSSVPQPVEKRGGDKGEACCPPNQRVSCQSCCIGSALSVCVPSRCQPLRLQGLPRC